MKTKDLVLILFGILAAYLLASCKRSDEEIPGKYQVFTIDENSVAGTVVGQVMPGHYYSGETEYSIQSGNTDNAFEISAAGGIITVRSEDAIDFEKNPRFYLVVAIKNSKLGNLNSIVEIEIRDISPPTIGLYLALPFNGNLDDMSPYSNNGLDHTSRKYVTGKRDLALDFNGTSDYIELTESFNSGYGLSFSFWVYTRGAAGAQNNGVIISKYSMSGNRRCFMVYSFGSYESRSDNRLAAAFYRDGASSSIHDHVKSYMKPEELPLFQNPQNWSLIEPKRLVPGVWTHCVINVTVTAIEAWINGKLCVRKLRDYGYYFDSQEEKVLIGNCHAVGEGSNNHFNGMLDDLRVYYRGLTPAEIQSLYKE